MKRKTRLLSFFFVLILVLSSFSTVPVSAASPKLNKTKVTILKGKTYQLKVKGSKKVKWSSNKKSVAAVSSKGKVKAKKVGKATIYAKTKNKTYKCKVTVVQPVTKIKLNATNLSLTKGEAYTLKATVSPKKAKNKKVSWESSNANVVIVKNGTLTTVGEGTATITASAMDGSGEKASCNVTVVKPKDTTPVTPAPKVIAVEKIQLNINQISMVIGETQTLKASVLPSNATDKTIAWSSSNPDVATIEDGVVTAMNSGVTTITAIARNKQSTCVVTVEKKSSEEPPTPSVIEVESITLDFNNITMEVGNIETLEATILPSNATDKTIIWSSSNQNVATVEDGVVTAISDGVTTITASAGNKTATCDIYVLSQNEDILLNKNEVTLEQWQKETLIAELNPNTEENIIWTSTDRNIVNVYDGVLEARKEGTAIITATVGDKSTNCIVHVTVPDISEVLPLGEYSISGGKSQGIYYMNSNENICNNIQWKLISGDKKAIFEQVSGIDTSEGPWAYVGIKGNIQGDVVVGAYYNNTLLATATVHVTSDNEHFVRYENWKVNKKKELWTENMSEFEKLKEFEIYSVSSMTYPGKGNHENCIIPKGAYIYSPWQYACEGCYADCIDASVFLKDIADDLGLESKYIGYSGIVSDTPDGVVTDEETHVMPYIHLSDGWHKFEPTPWF